MHYATKRLKWCQYVENIVKMMMSRYSSIYFHFNNVIKYLQINAIISWVGPYTRHIIDKATTST